MPTKPDPNPKPNDTKPTPAADAAAKPPRPPRADKGKKRVVVDDEQRLRNSLEAVAKELATIEPRYRALQARHGKLRAMLDAAAQVTP